MSKNKDSLGDRMKDFYENRTRILLPRRTYTIIRIDGKAFHSYTKGLQRPFDYKFINDMDETAIYMCKNIQGSKFAFVQSDEISILLTDFDNQETDAWFDGNIQKMASVSASLATAKFNQLRFRQALLDNQFEFYKELDRDIKISIENGERAHRSRALQSNEDCFNNQPLAMFDARVFTIPSNEEVENYFIWRQNDTTRNSISSLAQSLFSHKELENKNGNELQEMCFQKGVNWNELPVKVKRGRLIIKEEYQKEDTTRTRWISSEPPIFTQDRMSLYELYCC